MKRFSNKSASKHVNALPKRPRMGITETHNVPSALTTTLLDDEDPFADDNDWCITADELRQVESLESQAISNATKSGDSSAVHKKNIIVTTLSKKPNDLMKLEHYQKKTAELEISNSRKDGENKILRERLAKVEKEKMEINMNFHNLKQIKESEKAKKDELLEKELESVRGQMEFREAEILESQNLIRTLEQKNKMLLKNHKTSFSSPNKQSSSCGKRTSSEVLNSSGFEQSQEIAGSAKRIKFVKPKPSFVIRRNSAGKHDDPKMKISPRKHVLLKATANNHKEEMDKHADIPIYKPRRIRVNSCGHNDLLKVQIVGNEAVPSIPLLTCLQSEDVVTDDARPPSFSKSMQKNSIKSAIQGLQNLSMTCSRNKSFGLESSDMQNYIHLLPIVQSALSRYIKLCCALLTTNKGKQNDAMSKVEIPVTQEQIYSSTEKVVAGLQMLKTIVENVPSVVYVIIEKESKDASASIVENLKLLCSAQYWCKRLPSCYDITTSALAVLYLLLRSCNQDDKISTRFHLVESSVGPMLQCQQMQLKCNLLDVLILCLHFNDYVEALATGGVKSVVSRICDLYNQRQPSITSESTWLMFLSKAVQFMSILVSSQKEILKKYECFADIYHASDVMLYNQLTKRKGDTVKNIKRDQAISHALWLLHSCTTVYADGIPNSRLEHKHPMVLIMLEKFHNETADHSSFWNQELNRVLQSEVKSLYEENKIP